MKCVRKSKFSSNIYTYARHTKRTQMFTIYLNEEYKQRINKQNTKKNQILFNGKKHSRNLIQ